MPCMVTFGKEDKQHSECKRQQVNKATAPDFLAGYVAPFYAYFILIIGSKLQL